MRFAPVRYVLPGYIPEGVTLLVGRPKVGKSWFVLDLCVACATGRTTLGGINPVQGDVLYLALEDGKRRLQRRIDKLMGIFQGEWPERLMLAPMGTWPRLDQGGLAEIEKWCRSVTEPRLVVIDTLQRIRQPANGKAPLYSADYESITGLQKLATELGIAIVVLHHDRKADADDAFDTVSGTLGLTGAADTILMLKRGKNGVVLHARGRDIEESETAMQFDKESCRAGYRRASRGWATFNGPGHHDRSRDAEPQCHRHPAFQDGQGG
jgi:RecA-family ATPase